MPAGKERTILCLDCGAEVRTRYSRTLRCPECAEKHRIKEKEKRLAKLREQNRTKEKGPVQCFNYQFCDSPENIQKCLNCTRRKCNDCLSYLNQRRKREKMERSAANA